MKSFQIKDLMVTLDPQNLQAPQQPICQLGCSFQAPSFCHFGCSFNPTCHLGCSIFITPITCHFGCSIHVTPITCQLGCSIHLPSIIRTPTILDFTTPVHAALPNLNQSELEQLRGEISDLQKKVEEQIKQTPEDLDMLEGKLKEALEEIATQKANLNKGK